MPLYLYYKDIKDQSLVLVDPEVRGQPVGGPKCFSITVETVMWYTLALGINTLTEKTVDEFYARMILFDTVGVPLRLSDKGHAPISYEELLTYLGLRTNVDNMSRTKFLHQLFRVDILPKLKKAKLDLSVKAMTTLPPQVELDAA